MLVWDFDHALTNRLGGEYNVFARSPSQARTYLDPGVNPPSSKFSLRISAHRARDGFCGVWFNFYPAATKNPKLLNARSYRYLSLWVKGEKGGEDFDLTLKDNTWPSHQDHNPTVSLHSYLPGGASTVWRRVLIPLADFYGLDLRRIYDMSLQFAAPGDYRVYLDSVAFTTDSSAPGPEDVISRSFPAFPHRHNPGRALWVWETDRLLGAGTQDEAERFFRFCAEQGVRDVFLSVGFDWREGGAATDDELLHAAYTREFLVRAHQQGLEVEALAGTPEWAVQENYARALAAVEAVEAFNRAGTLPARFDGVHFDVEPYLLLGYADSVLRLELLKEYLEMIARCAARARSAHLRFGCDAPDWFYPAHELERRELSVDFRGKQETVGEHLSDLVDTVTIMDYHNEADGAGGIIAAGLPALEYAAARGKKIRVGVETSFEPDRVVYFAAGLPVEEFQKRLAETDLGDRFSRHGWRLMTFSDGRNIHVGMGSPPLLEGEARKDFLKALAQVARQFGASSDPQRFPPGPILEKARGAVERNPDWKDFEPFYFAAPETGHTLVGFTAVHGMSPQLTFHNLGRQVFEEETRSVLQWLSPYSSFAGLAIHHYESFRNLWESKWTGRKRKRLAQADIRVLPVPNRPWGRVPELVSSNLENLLRLGSPRRKQMKNFPTPAQSLRKLASSCFPALVRMDSG